MENRVAHLLHPAIFSEPTKLEVAKPEVDVAFIALQSELVNVHNPEQSSEIGLRLLELLIDLLHQFARHGLLAEPAESVELSLVLDVGQEILLQRTRTLQPVLELSPLLHDLRDLAPAEEAALLEVVELVHHALQTVLHHVRHGFPYQHRQLRQLQWIHERCCVAFRA